MTVASDWRVESVGPLGAIDIYDPDGKLVACVFSAEAAQVVLRALRTIPDVYEERRSGEDRRQAYDAHPDQRPDRRVADRRRV